MRTNKGIKKSQTITFTKKAVREYLDKSIIYWWARRDSSRSEVDTEISTNYVDAFQSVRNSLFGELLPLKQKTKTR
jgi:hypothetical protein